MNQYTNYISSQGQASSQCENVTFQEFDPLSIIENVADFVVNFDI